MTENRIEFLQRMPVFGGVSEDTLRFILDKTRDVALRTGDCFFREGDPASSIFVLEDGRVEVVRAYDGQEFRLNELGPGDCFGEMSLIECRNRSASVRALEDCSAIELPLDILHALFERDMEQFVLIQLNVAREISRRLRAADRKLFEEMAQTSGERREHALYVV